VQRAGIGERGAGILIFFEKSKSKAWESLQKYKNFFVNYFRRPWNFKRKMDEISSKMYLKNEKKVDGRSLEKWMEVLG